MMKKQFKALICTIACFGFGVQEVAATPILATGAANQLNFNLVQNLQDTDHSGTVSPGDLIYGIFNVTRISSGGGTLWNANNVPGPGVDSLSGYYVAAVDSIIALPAPWAAAVTMRAVTSDPNGVLSASDLAAHTVAKLFTDSGTPFDTSGSVASGIAKATDGTLWAALGLDSGYWNVLVLKNGVISASGGLNFTSNQTGRNFSHQINPSCSSCPAVDFYFDTIATDNGLGQPWRFSGGNNGYLSTVPEPSALLLMMAGLLGWVISRGDLRFSKVGFRKFNIASAP